MYYAMHQPILEPALKDCPYGRLLMIRTLDSIHTKKATKAAAKRLYELHFYCDDKNHPDRAMYNFLCGMYSELRGNHAQMASRFRLANKFGHTYHLIHVKLGLYYLYNRSRYDDAYTELDAGIDCLYHHPPLTDDKRRVIASIQAGQAAALVMMHRTEEAESMLQRAETASGTDVYLHAQAMLHAVRGEAIAARTALDKLREQNDKMHALVEENANLVLAGTHPHFSAKVPDQKKIADYWAWFVREEKELLRLMADEAPGKTYDLNHPHFNPMTPEPDHIDRMYVGFDIRDGQPVLTLKACYSRNYDALIDALIAACPPEILSRWKIERMP